MSSVRPFSSSLLGLLTLQQTAKVILGGDSAGKNAGPELEFVCGPGGAHLQPSRVNFVSVPAFPGSLQGSLWRTAPALLVSWRNLSFASGVQWVLSTSGLSVSLRICLPALPAPSPGEMRWVWRGLLRGSPGQKPNPSRSGLAFVAQT